LDAQALALDLSDVDVVCSGGGNYDAFYMGFYMVLSKLAEMHPEAVAVHRFAGVSAGGMMPFEVALKGLEATLVSHLSYGVLTQTHPEDYSGFLRASYLEDHHWRIMADWQTETYGDVMPERLDGVVTVGTSCLAPLPTLVLIDAFTPENDQSTHAFMSTGTYAELYDGMLCTDGGMTTGEKMTPLFQDKLRPQIIVDLMATGFPSEMVYKVVLADYVDLIKVGMDEAVLFLTEGETYRDGIITLCPTDADVTSFVCKV
jgi:hypothetical protein